MIRTVAHASELNELDRHLYMSLAIGTRFDKKTQQVSDGTLSVRYLSAADYPYTLK
jgi:hypothetical protein